MMRMGRVWWSLTRTVRCRRVPRAYAVGLLAQAPSVQPATVRDGRLRFAERASGALQMYRPLLQALLLRKSMRFANAGARQLATEGASLEPLACRIRGRCVG